MGRTFLYDKTNAIHFDKDTLYKTTCRFLISTPSSGTFNWNNYQIRIGLIGFSSDSDFALSSNRVIISGASSGENDLYQGCFFHTINASGGAIQKDVWNTAIGYSSNIGAVETGNIIQGTNGSAYINLTNGNPINDPGRIYTNKTPGAITTKYIVPIIVIENNTGVNIDTHFDSIFLETVTTEISGNQIRTGVIGASTTLWVGKSQNIRIEGGNSSGANNYMSISGTGGNEMVKIGDLSGVGSNYGIQIKNKIGNTVFAVDDSGTATIDNIQMGINGKIYWNSIATSGGGYPNGFTQIGSNFLSTGEITADKITTGTLSADRLAANSILSDKLTIAKGTNICNPLYSSWPSSGMLFTEDVSVKANVSISDVVNGGYSGNGSSALRLSATTSGADGFLYLTKPTATSYNIQIQPNKIWILSAYAKSTISNSAIQLRIKTPKNGGTYYAINATANSTINTWKRVYGTINLTGDDSTSALIRIDNDGPSGCNVDFDQIQLEEYIGNIALSSFVQPTSYNAPSSTVISGNQITTGTLDASRITVKNLIVGGSAGSGNNVRLDTSDPTYTRAQDAYDGTSLYRNSNPPTNQPTALSASSAATSDGNILVTLSWNYTQGALPADSFIIYTKEPSGTIVSTDPSFMTDAATGSNKTLIYVKPNSTYSFGVQAVRKTESGLKGTSILQANIPGVASNYTGNINFVLASTLTSQSGSGATAFTQTQYYRNDSPPTNLPSAPTVSFAQTSDGNVLATISWTYTQGALKADFISVYFKEGSSISPTDPSIVTDAASGTSSLTVYVKPNSTYSFGLRAGRRTESGINNGAFTTLLNQTTSDSKFGGSFERDVPLYAGIKPKLICALKSNADTTISIASTKRIQQLGYEVQYSTIASAFNVPLSGCNNYDIIIADYNNYGVDSSGSDFIKTAFENGNKILVFGNDSSTSLFYIKSAATFNPRGSVIKSSKSHVLHTGWSEIPSDTDSGILITEVIEEAIIITSPASSAASGNRPADTFIITNTNGGMIVHCQTRLHLTDEGSTTFLKNIVEFMAGNIISNIDSFGYNGKYTATELQNSAANYNTSNDNNSNSIVNATVLSDFTAIEHSINTDGTANISFNWSYPSLEIPNIDGFQIFSYTATSNNNYTFGQDTSKETVAIVPSNKSSYILYGVPSNNYYKFGVRPYRIVNSTIASAGIITSPLIVSSAASSENPYRPSENVQFAGNVIGSIAGTAATSLVSWSSGAYNGTSNYRNTNPPQNIPTTTTLTQTGTSDGNIVVNATWSYSQGTPAADHLYFFIKEGGGQVVQSDPCVTLSPLVSSVNIGLKPEKTYSFALQAGRRTESGTSLTSIGAVATLTTSSSNFTGNINSLAASALTSQAVSAFIGTSNFRNTNPPTGTFSCGSPSATSTPDGNIVVSIPYTVGALTVSADNLYVYVKEGGGLPSLSDTNFALSPQTGALNLVLKPSTTYGFGIRLTKRIDSGIVGTNIVTSSSASAFTTPAGNYSGTINSISASDLTKARADFNNSNNRNGNSVQAPTIKSDSTAIDHTVNDDGSVNISFEWSYPVSGEGDIDGFAIYSNQSTASSQYSLSATGSENTFIVQSNKRAIVFYGVPANKYYTFGVEAYRSVDKDIDPTGIKKSAIVSPSASGENPYRPSSNVAFLGTVTGMIDSVPASSLVSNASSGVVAYNGTVQYRIASSPSASGSFGTITQAQTDDGNIVVTVPYTYTQGAIKADQLYIYTHIGSGTATDADPTVACPATSGSETFILKPNTLYKFGLQAVRRTENGFTGGGIVQSTSITTSGSNFNGTINGVLATSLIASANNYSLSNDRKTTAPATPFFSMPSSAIVDFTQNVDSTINISVEWNYTNFTAGNDQYDIDGFFVYLHDNGTLSPPSQINFTDPANISNVTVLDSTKRAVLFNSVSADHYYTFGIQAYRNVDTSITASGVLVSSIAIPSGSEFINSAWNSGLSVAYSGDISGTVDGQPVRLSSNDLFNSLSNAANSSPKFFFQSTDPFAKYPISFTRASTALCEDGSTAMSGSPRMEDGKYGQAIKIEDGVTNLFTSPDSCGNAPWLASNSGSLSNTIVAGLYTPWSNQHSYTKVTVGAAQTGCHAYQQKTLSLNTKYTVSSWIYIPSSTVGNVSINVWYINGSWVTKASGPIITERDVWVRKSFTFTSDSVFAEHIISIGGLSVSSAGNYFYVTRAQLEQRSYYTSFHNGTRNNESLVLPTIPSNSSWSIEMWASFNYDLSHWLYGESLGRNLINLGTGFRVWGYQPNGAADTRRLVIEFGNDSGAVRQYQDLSSTSQFAKDQWNHLAFTFDISTSTFKAYRNGVLWATKTVSLVNAFNTFAIDYAGWTIDDLRISKVARTSDEIYQNFSSSTPVIEDSSTEHIFRFDTDLIWVDTSGSQHVTKTYDGVKWITAATVGAPLGTYIGSTAVSAVEEGANNYNASNDSNLSPISIAPTIPASGTAIDHTINKDGSANISFEWGWAGDEATIDGFHLFTYQSTSSSAYSFGTTPSNETVYELPASKRAFFIYGVPADKYYTFGVRAYRAVNKNIVGAPTSGLITTSIIKSTWTGTGKEDPYQPSSIVEFTGNLSGTIDSIAASSIRSSAASGQIAFSETAQYRINSTPTNSPTAVTATTGEQTSDGNVITKISWSYTQGAVKADFLLVYSKEGSTAPISTDPCWSTNATGGSLYLTVKPSTTYSFGVQAVRRTESGVIGGSIVSITSVIMTGGNYTGNIGGLNTSIITGLAGASFYDFFEMGDAGWTKPLGIGEVTSVSVTGASGGKALRFGNNSGNDEVRLLSKALIPFDPTKLYKVSATIRSLAGTGVAYVGLTGVSSDGETYISYHGSAGPEYAVSNQHYIAAIAVTPSASWTEYIGYVKGNSTQGTNGTNVASPNINSPAKMHTNVRYIKPLVLGNLNSQAGIFEVSSFTIEIINSESLSAYNAVNILNDDTALSPLEKQVLRREWETAMNDRKVFSIQASSYSITTEYNAYSSAFVSASNALGTYSDILPPGTPNPPSYINDTNINSNTLSISASSMRASWTTYYNSKQALQNKITDSIKSFADLIKVTADGILAVEIPNSAELFSFEDNITGSKGTSPLQDPAYISANPITYTRRYGEGPFGNNCIALEKATTNLYTYQNDLSNAIWTKTALQTIVNNLIIPNTSSSTHSIYQQYSSFVSGNNYTFSFEAKSNGYNYVQVFSSTCFITSKFVNFDLQSGLAVFTASSPAYTATKLSDGWVRISFTDTAISSGAGQIALAILPANNTTRNPSYTGNGVSGIYLRNMQLEQSSYPTSYTTGTRPAGRLVYSGLENQINYTNFSVLTWIKRTVTSDGLFKALFGSWPSSSGRFVVQINTSGCLRLVYNGSPTVYFESNLSVNDGNWHLIGISVDSSTSKIRIYKDDQYQETSYTAMTGTLGNFVIGQNDKTNTTFPAEALLSNMVIYKDYAITVNEVKAIYANQKPFYDKSVQIIAPNPLSVTTGNFI